jgi:hypothetical protein
MKQKDTVLKICSKSGTTMCAALETQRNFISYETNKHQFQGASERVKCYLTKLQKSNVKLEMEDTTSNDENEETEEPIEKVCVGCENKFDAETSKKFNYGHEYCEECGLTNDEYSFCDESK